MRHILPVRYTPDTMPPAHIRLIAFLLLLVQSAIALTPGQVLCIPFQNRGTIDQGAHAACGPCDSDDCGHNVGGDNCRSHDDGPFSGAMHPNAECVCHLHVPVPDNEQVPSNSRGDNSDLRGVVVPLLVAAVVVTNNESLVVAVQRFRPPDFSVSDQVLTLKATRLLI